MAEQQATTPTDVAATQPEQSFDDKLLAKMGFGGPEPTEEATEQPSPEAPAQEANPDGEEVEITEEQEATQGDGLEEILHKGEIKRVSKEQMRNLAQKGFDYESNQQRLNADYQRVQSMAKALETQASLQPQLLEAYAEAKSVERQLKPYENVDWVALAAQDDGSYNRHRAVFDSLKDAYQQALQKANKVQTDVAQAQQHVNQQQLAVEMQRLQERVPEWRDSERLKKDSQEILGALIKNEGFTQEELNTWGSLFADHRVVNMMRKAWKYDQAVANSKSKKSSLQSLPQVPKPGVRQNAPSAADQTREVVKQLHQAKDPERKKSLFDAALAAKMKRLGI